MIATSGSLPALEYTKYVFRRGSAPDPAGGAYRLQRSPRPSSWLKEALLLREGQGRAREGKT